MSRTISIIGQIDSDSLKLLDEELRTLEDESSKPIKLILCSEGGDTYSGLAMYSRIRHSKCDIFITAIGQVMSAATIVLAAGDVRNMCKDAWFMVHDDEDPPEKVKKSEVQLLLTEAIHYENLEQQWAEILSRHSNKSKQFWRKLSKKTTYLSAEKCLELGIVDEII